MNKTPVRKDKHFFWKLFSSTFTLSAFTFGGGYVIVPLMQKRFVEELKWIDEDEMLDLVAIGQSAPGPIAVNTSILVGYRMAGIPGALLSVFGTVLPPLITITVISYFYIAFRDNPIVKALLWGMQAGVAAVIVDVIISMASKVIKNKRILPIAVMVLAFITATFFDINIVIILLICGALGAYTTFRTKRLSKQKATENIASDDLQERKKEIRK
ncbi:MAG: chromate transporter [Clostridiaceae bacterium]|jgi:chromate transporter|nr:chromate transporter [Clostridiaceae bacterium]